MNSLNELIYQYVSEQKEPVTIGMVASIEELKGRSRREIGAILLQLQRERAIFRTVKDGKAYYSISAGASLNPTQQYIDNVQNALNNALGMTANPELQQAKELIGALNELGGALEDAIKEEHVVNTDIFNLNYSEGKKVSCEEFTANIPDGFRLLEGQEGREFIFYYPTEETSDEDYAASPIVFFAGQSHPQNNVDKFHLPETIEYIVENSAWQSMGQLDQIFGKSELTRLNLENIKGYYIYQDSHPGVNYQINIVYRGGYKQLRVMVNCIVTDEEKEASNKMVSQWLSSIVLKEEFPKRKALSDGSFFGKSLTKKAIDEWFEYADQWINQYKIRSNAGMQAEIAKYNYNNQRFSFVKAKSLLTVYMQENVDAYNMLLKEIEALLLEKSESGCASDKLLYLYEKAKEIASLEEFNTNIDDNTITLKSDAKSTQKVIKTSKITEMLDEEKRIEAEKKAEAEAEKKRLAEEKAAKEAEEKRVLELRKQQKEKICAECDLKLTEYKRYVKASIASVRSFSSECSEEYIETLELQKMILEKKIKETDEKKKGYIRDLNTELTRIKAEITACEKSKKAPSSVEKQIEKILSKEKEYEKAIKTYLAARFPYENELDKAFEAYKKAHPRTKVDKTSAKVIETLPAGMDLYYEDEAMSQKPYPEGDKLEGLIAKVREEIQEDITRNISKAKSSHSSALQNCREKQIKRTKTKATVWTILLAIVAIILLVTVILPNVNYNKAMTALHNNQFDEAYALFDKLDDFKDSYDMLDEVQYQKGLYLYNQGKWQESIDVLSEFSYYDDRYDDAEDIIDKARDKMTDETYQKALEYEKNGNRSQAIELYETIDSYKDSEERINALKYAYVLENKNNTNSTTYEYLKDLKYDNYKDSKDIYNSLYAWKVSIVVNSSANDYTTNRTSISRSSPIYFHIKLSGGPPNGSTRVRYSYELPNGRTGSGSHDGYWNAGSSGSNYWDDGLYQNPAYGETGNLKMEYKDSDGNIIGSVTVRITR